MEVPTFTLTVVGRSLEAPEFELAMGVQQRGEWNNRYNFPGGKIEPGETAEQSAVREVFEETGLEIRENALLHLGYLLTTDLRPAIPEIATVAVFGAVVESGTELRSDPDEFICDWVNPRDRNILLSMPFDVRYWLPLAFRDPRYPFVCLRTTDDRGGDTVQTWLELPDGSTTEVNQPLFNL